MFKHRPNLAALAVIALAGAVSTSATQGGVTHTAARPPRPRGIVRDEQIKDARAREVSAWNAAVDRRKAEKKRRQSGA
ncbi:hypothetical protein [Roseateles cavernae]|uniref:hypothetical protein n=1 Tax=Roseateles cavernae TaxID=3153578 RepID=UPI0032E45C59